MLKPYIMYAALCLVGCGAATDVQEDDMTVARHEQQRSKSGLIQPGSSSSAVLFTLPYMLDAQGYQDPGNYTVQFNVSDPNVNLSAGDFVRARAEIFWVNGGNQTRRVCDCGNGVSVSGTCEGVTVKVYDDSITNHGSTFVPYNVSITVAKGSRASIQQPPVYSLDLNTLLSNSANVENIPPNIGAVSTFVTLFPVTLGTAVGAYDIRVSQNSPSNFRLKQYDPRQSDWVPLVPGATSLRLTSSAAAPDVNYQIAFGIDG